MTFFLLMAIPQRGQNYNKSFHDESPGIVKLPNEIRPFGLFSPGFVAFQDAALHRFLTSFQDEIGSDGCISAPT
jgi:hypothetical protein